MEVKQKHHADNRLFIESRLILFSRNRNVITIIFEGFSGDMQLDNLPEVETING
jgi:hypothetical protein